MAKFMLVVLFLVVIVGGFYLIHGSIKKQLNFSANFGGASSTPQQHYISSPLPPRPSPPPVVASSAPTPASGSVVSAYDIPDGYTLAELSPYFHKVRLGSLYAGSDFSTGLTSLYAGFYDSVSVDITGWEIRARDGDQFVPRAVNTYDPSGLSSETDIVLKGGDTLNIYTTQSAIGENLRLNKCLGYLENTNHFAPSLPMDCPHIDRSELTEFSGECQDYISSLGGCRLPDPNPPIPPNDDACRYYLDTINYKGCFEKHRGDHDFLSHEWRVWSGSSFLNPRHDHVLLLDKNGLLVDLRDY